jgi:hypothetical protein
MVGKNAITGNECVSDLPDASRNGQCWWGGDLFSNGGPVFLAPNGQKVNAAGGGTAWVGDYSIVALTDNVPRHYSNFQGMSQDQTFTVTSTTVTNVIDPWSTDGHGGGVYGHPSLQTCTGGPLAIAPGAYYTFIYDPSSPGFAVTQTNCPVDSGVSVTFVSLSPNTLHFGSQTDGTASAAQTITVTNISTTAITLLIASSDDFNQTNTCSRAALASGAQCTISVVFSPTIAGGHAGTVTITNSNSGLSETITLTGTGELNGAGQPHAPPATISLTSSLADLQLAASGPPVTVTLITAPQNGFTGTVTLKCQIIPQDQSAQGETPTCSLTPNRITLGNNLSAKSSLTISSHATGISFATGRRVSSYKRMPLAGFSLLGLVPLALLRRKSSLIFMSIICLTGLIGCGYSPNSPSRSSYELTVTASSGDHRLTSISIPVEIQ